MWGGDANCMSLHHEMSEEPWEHTNSRVLRSRLPIRCGVPSRHRGSVVAVGRYVLTVCSRTGSVQTLRVNAVRRPARGVEASPGRSTFLLAVLRVDWSLQTPEHCGTISHARRAACKFLSTPRGAERRLF